jgi:Flp pilus assembly pilin Flp
MIELGLILAVVALVAAVAIRTLGVDIREVATAAGCFLVPSNMGCSAYGG